MKKISPLEIFIIFLVIFLAAFYVIPKITLSLEQKEYGKMQLNAAMMTSKILAEFSDNTGKKTAENIALDLSGQMNELAKNPVDKKNPAYSVDIECQGCVILTADNKMNSIVLTGKDRQGNLILRTVIQPPSFVTYTKDFNEK